MNTVKPTRADAYKLFHQGAIALAQVEHNGIRMDEAYLADASARLAGKIKKLEDKLRQDEVFGTWRKRYGEKTVLGSRTQLGEVLFKVMGLPSPGYTDATQDDDYEGERRHRAD